jgi:hypothetical protein
LSLCGGVSDVRTVWDLGLRIASDVRTFGTGDCVFCGLGAFPIIYYHFDQNRCLGVGIANCKVIRKKQAHFFAGDTFICGEFGGVLRKVRKRGFCLIIPKKGAFLSDFVRFCQIL